MQFTTHFDVVKVAVTGEQNLIGARQTLVAQDLLFNHAREHVDATHDQHIVGPSGNAVHAPEAARGGWQQAGQVTGAVANHRHRLFGKRGKNQFTFLAIGHHFTGIRVDDFWIKMILPNYRTVFGFDTFTGNTGSHHFRQTVDVDGFNTQLAFNLIAHAMTPRLGAEDADFQRDVFGFDALALKLLRNDQRVGRGHHDDLRLEILDQLHLLFGLATRHRHHHAAGALGAVMGAHTASEQAVAVGDVAGISGAASRCTD